MTYEAFVLSPESRAQVLAHFPPMFDEVVAHHVTHAFGVSRDYSVGTSVNKTRLDYGVLYTPIKVIGHIANEGIQAIVVEVVGAERKPNGDRYHVTISYNKDKGYKPYQSNKLIADNEDFVRTDQTFISGTFEYI